MLYVGLWDLQTFRNETQKYDKGVTILDHIRSLHTPLPCSFPEQVRLRLKSSSILSCVLSPISFGEGPHKEQEIKMGSRF